MLLFSSQLESGRKERLRLPPPYRIVLHGGRLVLGIQALPEEQASFGVVELPSPRINELGVFKDYATVMRTQSPVPVPLYRGDTLTVGRANGLGIRDAHDELTNARTTHLTNQPTP